MTRFDFSDRPSLHTSRTEFDRPPANGAHGAYKRLIHRQIVVIARVLGLVAIAALTGCGPSVQVRRMAANENKDLSGRWNETDSRLVAEEMIADSLSRPWLANATKKTGNPPTVIVGQVHNDSMEHIDCQAFVEDLQRSLINSGRVEFVASAMERSDVRRERLDQDTNASEATRKAHGEETGADYVLSGRIASNIDREGGESVVAYQIDLKLLDVQSNKIVWHGAKKIKKSISRSSTEF